LKNKKKIQKDGFIKFFSGLTGVVRSGSGDV
jgi:hypothetical protein